MAAVGTLLCIFGGIINSVSIKLAYTCSDWAGHDAPVLVGPLSGLRTVFEKALRKNSKNSGFGEAG